MRDGRGDELAFGVQLRHDFADEGAVVVADVSRVLFLDIDGVLMLGSNAIPAGANALKVLEEKKIPYILLTNGGGKWEADRVAELSQRLGVNVLPFFNSINSRFRSISLSKVIRPTNIFHKSTPM